MSISLYTYCTPDEKKHLLKQRRESLVRLTEQYRIDRESLIRDIHELEIEIKKDGEQDG